MINNRDRINNQLPKIENKFHEIIEVIYELPDIQREQTPALDKIFIKDRYLTYQAVTSKAIRNTLYERHDTVIPKLRLPEEFMDSVSKSIKKIKNTRPRNTFLRNYNGDVFTLKKLKEKGLVDNDNCLRCGAQESQEHLLFECWYPVRIWSCLISLYRLTEIRPRNYTLNGAFILGLNLSRVKMNLHLENCKNA